MIFLVKCNAFVSLFCIVLVLAGENNETSTELNEADLAWLEELKNYNSDNATAFNNVSSEQNSSIKARMPTPCLTPNQDPAYCLEIQKCDKLLQQLSNTDARKFLIQSRCGPQNEDKRQPKVCCGKYDNFKHLVKNKNPLPKKCGYQNMTIKNRIFGGTEAELSEFPWMARLIHKNKLGYRNFGCSGFLIHSKYVLTAAHCLESDNIAVLGPVFEVQLGEHNIETEIDCDSNNRCSDKPQKIRVNEVIVHHKYSKYSLQHHYDIGLIHLNKGAKLTEFVRPICLLEESEEFIEYWISGWGKTENRDISPIKMVLPLPKYPFDQCVEKYNNVDIRIVKSQICAGGIKNKDSCLGDSGGPLMAVKNVNQWFAAGVVSFGLGCGKEGWPGVYTNIPCYIEWIKKQMLKRATIETKSPKIKNNESQKT